MFRWLTGVFTGRSEKKKETEIRKLKEEIDLSVAQCRDAASKGDSEAARKLVMLGDTIAEQSVRFLRQNAKIKEKRV
jgi:hypothetical protein